MSFNKRDSRIENKKNTLIFLQHTCGYFDSQCLSNEFLNSKNYFMQIAEFCKISRDIGDLYVVFREETCFLNT